MPRRLTALLLLAFSRAAGAHDSGIEMFYAGGELLVLALALIAIVAMRAPWRLQLLALAILAAGLASSFGFGLIPLDGPYAHWAFLTWVVIPPSAIAACIVARPRR